MNILVVLTLCFSFFLYLKLSANVGLSLFAYNNSRRPVNQSSLSLSGIVIDHIHTYAQKTGRVHEQVKQDGKYKHQK